MKILTFLLALLPFASHGQSILDALRPGVQVSAYRVHQMTYKGKLIQGQNVVVGVLDTGINYFHPHLAGKVAFNTAEKIDQIDNDNNGYVDDIMGWNFFKNNGLVFDDHGHGTHVSGTITGKGYGIAPAAQVVPIKVTYTPQGNYDNMYLINAIRYAANNGVKIINMSLGGVYEDRPVTVAAIRMAVDYALQRNVLLIVSAGNSGHDISREEVYPSNFKSDNLISVCAVDSNDLLAPFSNYSALTVHVCAPGVNIASANKAHNPTNQEPAFQFMSGTSMAAPVVTGIAALIWSMEPNLTAKEVKEILITSTRKRSHLSPNLQNTSTTGGVINAYDAVLELMRRMNTYQ